MESSFYASFLDLFSSIRWLYYVCLFLSLHSWIKNKLKSSLPHLHVVYFFNIFSWLLFIFLIKAYFYYYNKLLLK